MKRSTKHSLIMSALSLLLCASMLIGTTFAWFTDSVTSTGNIIKSGTLDVSLEYIEDAKTDPQTAADTAWKDASEGAIFNYSNWEPGFVQTRHIKIENEGTLALKYKVNVIPTGETEQDGVRLSDVIDVYYLDPGKAINERTDLDSLTPAGTLTQMLAGLGTSGTGTLKEGEKVVLTIALKMQESAGNEYQNKKLGDEFAVQLLATQLEYEEDSFDNTYDKDATYVSAGTADELQAAIISGEPVTLTDDITMDVGNFTVAAGTEAVINLGGNDLTLTNADTTAAFLKVEGDLSITGEGNVAARQINTDEGSKLTLGEGVTIETSNSFAINNSGTTVIDGATINHTGTNHAIQNQGGTLIIDDATVTSTSTSNISTINSTGGTVIINGGTFVHEGSMGSVIEWLYSNEGEIIINGGTFIQKGGDPLASIDYGDAKLTINGGTFDSASYFAQPMQNIVINAGEFKNNAVVVFNPFMPWTIADKYIPATSTATTNADGSITVTVN